MPPFRSRAAIEPPRFVIPSQIPSTPRVGITWGDQSLSTLEGHEGFYRISGTTRTGKSHLTKLFIMDALREVESNPHAKLIVYEPKREFYAWLLSLGLKSPITYFCPSDERSVSLDFNEDYSDDKDAGTLANAFFPEGADRHESRFWGETLRTIYAGIYLAIKAKLGFADLRLMCLVLEDEKLTEDVLSFDPYLVQARHLAAKTGKSVNETVDNIRLNIQSRIGKMKVLAAHLDHAARQRPLFSLRRFINEQNSGVLVISKDSDYKHVQDPMNAVLLLRFTQLLDKQQQQQDRKIFVVIDEFPTLAGDDPCPGVKDMFLRLGSRGVIPLVTDQGLSTLKPIYQDNTTGILGQCSNVIYLRQPDVESAEDASRDLGTERGVEQMRNISLGGEYATCSFQETFFDRPIIHESQLRGLRLASAQLGIEGYARSALSSEKRPWPFTIPPEIVDAIPDKHPKIDEYIERPKETQRLTRLSPEEYEQLARDESNGGGGDLWDVLLNE